MFCAAPAKALGVGRMSSISPNPIATAQQTVTLVVALSIISGTRIARAASSQKGQDVVADQLSGKGHKT
jgi:hypothetical protein